MVLLSYVLTNMSTKDIILTDLDEAITSYNSLIQRNPDIKLLVDFGVAETNTENSMLKYIIIADSNGIRKDTVTIIADKAERLFNNNLKAMRAFVELANKAYYPILVYNDKRIAYEWINYSGLSKSWDEAS